MDNDSGAVESAYNPLDSAKVFNTIWHSKTDMLLWLVYNVGFGALPFWLAIVLHGMGSQAPGINDILKSGEITIFVTTLCALSMAFFAEMTRADFWNTRRVAFAIILACLIFSASVGAITRIPKAAELLGLYTHAISAFSITILVVAVSSCWYLYAMRLTVEREGRNQYSEEKHQQYADASNIAVSQTQTKSGEAL